MTWGASQYFLFQRNMGQDDTSVWGRKINVNATKPLRTSNDGHFGIFGGCDEICRCHLNFCPQYGELQKPDSMRLRSRSDPQAGQSSSFAE